MQDLESLSRYLDTPLPRSESVEENSLRLQLIQAQILLSIAESLQILAGGKQAHAPDGCKTSTCQCYQRGYDEGREDGEEARRRPLGA